MFYKQIPITSLFKMYARKLAIASMAIAIAILAWTNLLFQFNINANAATVKDVPFVIAIEGINDRIEGKVEKDIGTVQRNVGKVTGQTEGALKQAQGKAREDIGTTKNKLDNVKDEVEDRSEGFLDSVKEIFN